MDIQSQIEWLRKEAQRHTQSASDKAFTSRRRSTFKHRAKVLRQTADTMQLMLAVCDAAQSLVEVTGVDDYAPVLPAARFLKVIDSLAALEKSCTT